MVRILQIGVGLRGGHWARFVREHHDFVPVAYVDPDAAGRERARALGDGAARVFEDLEEALDAVEADAALIASPSAFHAAHAMRALEAGLTVFVEKPFAETVESALEVLRVAESTGHVVMVGENYRFRPAERTVRALVEEGRVGAIDHATLVDRRHMPSGTEGPWLARIEYPQLQEIAIHHFDSLRFMLGERPAAITAHAWNPPSSDYRHGACTQALIEFERVRAQYLGTLTSGRFSFSLTLEGETGEIWTNRKWVFVRSAGARIPSFVRNVPAPKGDADKYPREGTTSLLDQLRDLVERGIPPETVGTDNIWNVAMVEAAKRSDRERRVVPIDEVYDGSAATPGAS